MSSQKNHFNRLGGEKSPYLLQHKDNPVYWYAWGSDAFNAAKNENKPIFLSVGYSTCYWCHVMEKDSFEHQDVADVLNKHFISIKVDREELPDVDSIYMDAVVALTGHGGWPMSVFLTPELKPFFGGTFFYKKQFVQLLERVSEIWINNRDHLNQSADQISNFLKDRSPTAEEDTTELKDAALVDAFKELGQSFDPVHGGFGREPKFPPSAQIGLLFRIHRRSGNVEALKMAESTLTSMSYGGIYDHLGGGFHRYSTDNAWLIPHFEKMLYDNALLANVYLEAFQVTKRPLYRSVATEVLDYILRDMTDPDGGFYSAEDAGEVGREGEYYVWKEEELKNTLGAEDFEMLQKSYDISIQGNFEHGTNILSFNKNTSWEIKSEPKLKKIHDALFVLRSKRTRPLRDDKVLTAWNGLMIAAMAKAHQVVGEGKYKKAAKASAEFIKTKLWKNGQLLRRYRDEDARFSGSLDDYAFLIHGLISLYESTFENQWLDWAIQLQKTQDRLFWDVKDGGYFISSAEDNSLLYRKKTFVDGAIPSGNSISALNLLRLHGFTAEENYKETATTLLKLIVSESRRAPSAFATGLAALDYYLDFAKEIVVVGHLTSQAAVDFRHFLYQSFLPSKVIAYGEATSWDDETSLPVFRGKKLFNNLTTFYICEDNTCKSPTTDISTAKQLTETFSPFNF